MKAGPYQVQVIIRANCKRMILRCRPQEGVVTLTVPPGTTEKACRDMLDRHMDWIETHLGEGEQWLAQYGPGERHWCLGQLVTLGRDAPSGKEAYLRWRNGQLMRVLERLLAYWCRRMGVTVSHVTLQEMTSRWGSCRSKTHRLTFNTRLGLYDEAVIEQTVVHELCHFFHDNHSAAFYQEMTRWLPDWKARQARRGRTDVRPMPPNGR